MSDDGQSQTSDNAFWVVTGPTAMGTRNYYRGVHYMPYVVYYLGMLGLSDSEHLEAIPGLQPGRKREDRGSVVLRRKG